MSGGRTRILVTTAAALGHFHPLAAIASLLRARGADVRFATAPGFCTQVAEASFDVTPCGMDWQSRDLAETWPDFRLVPPEERNAWINSEIWARRLPEAMIPDLLRVVDGWQPSLILSGRAEVAGPMVGELRDVPHATISAGRVIGLSEFIASTRHGRAMLRSELGLDPDSSGQAMYQHLYLNQIPASFLPPEDAAIPTRRDFRPASFVESMAEPPAWLLAMEPGSVIYVTLGSILGEVWPDAFERVVEAVAYLGKSVVVTVGLRGDCKTLADRFPGVRVANYIPQRFALGRAALVICHGGINTVLGALSHGVPMLVLPTEQSDQRWNADCCQRLGVGIAIGIEQVDASAIRESASALLNESSYRRAAANLQDELLRLAPVEAAVELILQLASHSG